MHFQFSVILAIAATALTLPTADQTTSDLEKRDRHGWIGSFSDPQCHGPETGPRPEVHLGDCTLFSPANATGYFGIYFGTGAYGCKQMGFFTDAGCRTSVTASLGVPKGIFSKESFTSSNDFACVGVKDFVGPFASIHAYLTLQASDPVLAGPF